LEHLVFHVSASRCFIEKSEGSKTCRGPERKCSAKNRTNLPRLKRQIADCACELETTRTTLEIKPCTPVSYGDHVAPISFAHTRLLKNLQLSDANEPIAHFNRNHVLEQLVAQ